MKKLLPLFILFFYLPVWGATFYIDPDCATPGDGTTTTCDGDADDVFDGWEDVTFALSNDYYQKAGTTWAGKIIINSNGTRDDPLTVGIYGGSTRATIDATGETQGIVVSQRHYVEISDINIIGTPSNAGIVCWSGTSKVCLGFKVTNVDVSGSDGDCVAASTTPSTGDFPEYATGVVFDNVTVDSCGKHGIAIVGPYDGGIIRNSRATNVGESLSGWGLYGGGYSLTVGLGDWTDNLDNTYTATKQTDIDIESVIYSAVNENHWLVEDAALDTDYDFTHDATTVTIRLPAALDPETGCGCSTVFNYNKQAKNLIIEDSSCQDAYVNGGVSDGICIGYDRSVHDGIIRRNTVKDTDNAAIIVSLVDGGTINNNVVSGCGQGGEPCISARGIKGTSTVRIQNNTIYAHASTTVGIEAGGEVGSIVNITNNIIDNSPTTGIAVSNIGADTVSASYNDNTGTTAMGAGVTDGGNNITGDPLLINPAGGNFGLKAGSPAINTALTLQIHDLDYRDYNNRRGVGDGFDIGAIEYYNPSTIVPSIIFSRGNTPATLFAFVSTDKYLIEGTSDCYLIEGTADCLLLE